MSPCRTCAACQPDPDNPAWGTCHARAPAPTAATTLYAKEPYAVLWPHVTLEDEGSGCAEWRPPALVQGEVPRLRLALLNLLNAVREEISLPSAWMDRVATEAEQTLKETTT